MSQNIPMSFEVEMPLIQAERCVDIWLSEAKMAIEPRQKRRAVALVARYFHGEENIKDALILSFLRHYSGWKDIDMEDMSAVSYEIKNVLDLAEPLDKQFEQKPYTHTPLPALYALAFCAIFFMACAVIYVMPFASKTPSTPISHQESLALRDLVHLVAVKRGEKHLTVWAELKAPLKIRSYLDMDQKQYQNSKNKLIKWLDES